MNRSTINYSRSFFFKAFGIALYGFGLFLFSCSSGNEAAGQGNNNSTDSLTPVKENYTQTCAALLANARQMDSILLNQTEVDQASANRAIRAFTEFAHQCHADSLSPVYLVKTAQVARAINNIPQAKLVLDKCIEDYPSFKDRPAALFLLAQLYDEPTYLNDENEARRLYQKIIDEYPKSDWVASARAAIGFIGMTDQQILQSLKKKTKTP